MLASPMSFQRTRGAMLLSQLGLDQAQIARRCGVARSAVGHWMTGRARPGGDKRSMLARLYGIPFESWMESASAPLAVGRFQA
ncbi:helix-turn-helix domain-containing protein [Sorangium sp. So ce362]|uniref:helix-turn-helix domain-containing protein n=1 Tax=Sorangium sp. So ce362 TaxID=3133303 RepID=UPI003F62B488